MPEVLNPLALCYLQKSHCIEWVKTLVACGIKTYIFDSLRLTPQISFAIRHLGCVAEIVITVSHNQLEYNGADKAVVDNMIRKINVKNPCLHIIMKHKWIIL